MPWQQLRHLLANGPNSNSSILVFPKLSKLGKDTKFQKEKGRRQQITEKGLRKLAQFITSLKLKKF